MFRLYHDTSEWVELPFNVDARGTRRFEQNCTESGLCRPTATPPHLQRARVHLLSTGNIGDFASACGVRLSTAWNYVTKLCEDAIVASHVLAGDFVCPELSTAVSAVDLNGSLRSVMERIEHVIGGDTRWRCEHDRFAQLRLLRVCLTSHRDGRTHEKN